MESRFKLLLPLGKSGDFTNGRSSRSATIDGRNVPGASFPVCWQGDPCAWAHSGWATLDCSQANKLLLQNAEPSRQSRLWE